MLLRCFKFLNFVPLPALKAQANVRETIYVRNIRVAIKILIGLRIFCPLSRLVLHGNSAAAVGTSKAFGVTISLRYSVSNLNYHIAF